jgi:hypothetical protein
MIIVRSQFCRKDEEYHPEYNNQEYLEYETVSTGLSKEIISYGYQVRNGSSYRWIKISEAKAAEAKE